MLKWIAIITETSDEIIPKNKLNYFIHARESDYLKLLENTYKTILSKPVWTRNDLGIIKEMQRRILEENLCLSKEAWENKIEWLNEICKDSAKFWGNVKKLIGSDKEKIEYLIDSNNNNNKVYKDEEKEILYRSIWQKIFEIPPEENSHFDQTNENRVKAFLEHNQETIASHQYADLTCLDANNVLIKPVRVSDVTNIIRNFKNKAPGISGINKLILTSLRPLDVPVRRTFFFLKALVNVPVHQTKYPCPRYRCTFLVIWYLSSFFYGFRQTFQSLRTRRSPI